MKVLLLTQVLPYPPDSGPKVKTSALLRYLAQKHEVTLVSFTRGDQRSDVEPLRQWCRAVHTVPIERGLRLDIWYLARSLLAVEPFLIARDARAAMRRLVRDVAAGDGGFDIVHVDQLNMAQYGSDADPRAARVLDAHNALWLVTRRLAETLGPGPRRLLLEREARLLRRYEGRICREFEAVMAVSEEDREALLQAADTPIDVDVVPIAVDVESQPPIARRAEANRIAHVGSLIWPPSVDGLLWFLREVMPRIHAQRPAAEVDVVGGNPPREVVAWGERDHRVRVHGYVADPAAILRGAALMVVPLRAGGGMRVRILNALAQGVPLVSTSIGCEGIAVEPGRHLLIGDTAEELAAAVLRLLDDRELATSLALAGRRLAVERYDFRVVCRALDGVYGRAVERRRREAGR